MNGAIELHDSTLAAVIQEGILVTLSFSPAYVHRSSGRPGIDAGSGWTQTVTFTFADAVVPTLVAMPCWVVDGGLRINGVRHENLVPTEGVFDDHCELWLATENAETLTIRGSRLTVSLHGEGHYVEEVP